MVRIKGGDGDKETNTDTDEIRAISQSSTASSSTLSIVTRTKQTKISDLFSRCTQARRSNPSMSDASTERGTNTVVKSEGI